MANDNLLDHFGRVAGKCLHGAQEKLQGFQTSIAETFQGIRRAQGPANLGLRNPLAHRSAAPVIADKEVKDEAQQALAPWRRNPEWVDERAILEVSVPRGALCQLNSSFKVGLPPSTVFDILIDPENKRVFKDIQASTQQ